MIVPTKHSVDTEKRKRQSRTWRSCCRCSWWPSSSSLPQNHHHHHDPLLLPVLRFGILLGLSICYIVQVSLQILVVDTSSSTHHGDHPLSDVIIIDHSLVVSPPSSSSWWWNKEQQQSHHDTTNKMLRPLSLSSLNLPRPSPIVSSTLSEMVTTNQEDHHHQQEKQQQDEQPPPPFITAKKESSSQYNNNNNNNHHDHESQPRKTNTTTRTTSGPTTTRPRRPLLIIPNTSTNNTLPSRHELQQVQDFLKQTWNRSILPLAAVLEAPIPVSSNKDDDQTTRTKKPLPLRDHSSANLTIIAYPNHIQSCKDIPNQWPVGHSQEWDRIYGSNVNNIRSLYKIRHQYAETTCPVDADPFLPWIHDVFVTHDPTGHGGHDGRAAVQFIAHNKRRCNRDPGYFADDIANLEPQVTLMQSVPIQRCNQSTLDSILPELPPSWKEALSQQPRSDKEHWYRLVPLEQADASSQETRFLCQFFTLRPVYNTSSSSTTETAVMVQGIEKVIVGETWSTYPYNYEHANYQHRRGQMANPMLTRPTDPRDVHGIHNEQVWNSILHFQCPIPTSIHSMMIDQQHDATTHDIAAPSFYLDLVPVRTPPRENVTGYSLALSKVSEFDPILEWGHSHVLPPVRQSGRWANIPICPSPFIQQQQKEHQQLEPRRSDGAVVGRATTTTTGTSSITQDHPMILQETNSSSSNSSSSSSSSNGRSMNNTSTKPFFMVGCLWASAVFSERGQNTWDTNTMERLLEWLTYHLEIAGFDHMVVYDNTEAHTNKISLQPVTDLFSPSQVTRIAWKHRVCNNNGYEHPNGGERSSQYAAEASCRVRYGSMTEWLAFFDTDEYLIPSGNWSSIREWLQTGVQMGTIAPDTQILSFYENKARLNYRFTEPFVDDSTHECHSGCTACQCVKKRANATYLESYCEPEPFPRPYPQRKAKMKQIYRPSFVLNHFVHYATVTNFVHTRPNHPRVVGYPYERRALEFTEAYMLHTKTKSPPKTGQWNSTPVCSKPHKCPIGFAFPYYQGMNVSNSTIVRTGPTTTTKTTTMIRVDPRTKLEINEFGMPYNCYELQKVQEDLALRLHVILDPLKEKLEKKMRKQNTSCTTSTCR